MKNTMMDHALTTQMIFQRGQRLFADSRMTVSHGDRSTVATFAEIAANAERLAAALVAIGLEPGDRVATYSWNTREHQEAYLAVPSMGFVLHTLNVRLHAEQLSYIIDHADDRAIIVDAGLLDMLRPILAVRRGLRHLIVFGGGGGPIDADGHDVVIHRYEDLVAGHAPVRDWPQIDERQAAVACYTSGTTGNPKGVVYSHRSIFLHTLASLGVDTLGICNADRVLVLPPMFHANAWGLPYSCWMAGADMVMPGQHLQPEPIARLIEETRPTLTAAVPTIVNDLLSLHRENPIDMSGFRAMVSGGSAVSPHLIETVRDTWGIDIVQGWGMTETSPLCVLSHPPRGATGADATRWRAKSGRPIAGVNVRIVDDSGSRVAEDGHSVGRLQLKGPWIASGYHDMAPGETPLSEDGWLDTGDVGTIDALGYVQVTDRSKDLIKSGGEWISSADLENEIARCPGVREVAVVAVPDARWEERPLAIVCPEPGATMDFAAMRERLARKFARFMVPEYWTTLTDLPKTSVGKVNKKQLRDDVASRTLGYQRVDDGAVRK